MDEEIEEFFDCLDEEPSPEDTLNKSCSKNDIETKIPSPPINSKQIANKIDEQVINMGRSKIPIYVDVKNELTIKLEQNQQTKQHNSTSSISVKSKIKNVILPKVKPPKTYLGIFYAQHGINPKNSMKNITDSARANYGETTSRTSSSYNSCSSIDGPIWDTASMYDDYLVKLYPNKGDPDHSITKSITTDVDIDNLVSVSEAFIVNKKQKCTKKKIKQINLGVLRSPILGSLGPDLESSKPKMDRLKKQQEYGRQASIRNRVKILQNRTKENVAQRKMN